MASAPLFSRSDLDALARTPTEKVADAVATGDPSVLRSVVEGLERQFRGGLRGSRIWEDGTISALLELPDGRARLSEFATETSWTIAALNGVRADDRSVLDQHHGAPIEDVMRREGPDAALGRYVGLEATFRRLRDAHRDATSALWSILLELGGRDALGRCLRDLADGTLMVWMDRDIASPPDDRLREWSAVLTANFARIHIDELADRFRITQDPCGTCSRQVMSGRYGPPLDLATVVPFYPPGTDAVEMPIYRSHVGLMHWLMPRERIGAPWPAISCAAAVGIEPCQIDLMKDPLAPV
jgi:hypothetical protein